MANRISRKGRDWPDNSENAVGSIRTATGITYVMLVAAPEKYEWFYGYPVDPAERKRRGGRQGQIYSVRISRKRQPVIWSDGKVLDDITDIHFERRATP